MHWVFLAKIAKDEGVGIVDTFWGRHGTISSVVIIIIVGYIRRSHSAFDKIVPELACVRFLRIIEEVGVMKLPLFCFPSHLLWPYLAR